MKKITIISICGAFVLLLGILAGKLALDVSNDGLLDQNVEALAIEDPRNPSNGILIDYALEIVYGHYVWWGGDDPIGLARPRDQYWTIESACVFHEHYQCIGLAALPI